MRLSFISNLLTSFSLIIIKKKKKKKRGGNKSERCTQKKKKKKKKKKKFISKLKYKSNKDNKRLNKKQILYRGINTER